MAKPQQSPAAQARLAQALQQAVALHQQGRLLEAEALYQTVLKAAPQDFNALHLLGVLRHQQGRSVEALELIASALRSRSGSVEALSNHGIVLDSLGRHAEAVASYDRALRLKPAQVKTLCTRADALLKLGRADEALASCRKALAANADHADALTLCGNALIMLERSDEALASYERALALQPDHVDARVGRGSALAKLGRPDEALADYERALALRPNHVDALNNRGTALERLERADEALASFEAALALAPRHLAVLTNRGHVLLTLGRLDEALASTQAALAIAPDHVDALLNHGSVLDALQRCDEAERCYDRALLFRPDHVHAKMNKSLICLSQGRFAEGWPLYEQRWLRGAKGRDYAVPRWDGSQIPGRLLLWGEQGLGDAILHASMVPEVVARVGSLVLEVDPRLVALYARSFAGVDVVPLTPELHAGPIDAHLPLGSLGGYFRTSWESFPLRSEGYLVADRARAAALRERLTGDGRRLVGLSWRSLATVIGAAKSAQLGDFVPILRQPGYRFVDLQYGDTRADREAVERELGVRVERLDDIDNREDIDGLAALMTACDAVVTTSSVTAHLSGALGRPTWVFVPFGKSRIWYWFRDCEDSPWYPQVRLLRQADGQPWAELIAKALPDMALPNVEARTTPA